MSDFLTECYVMQFERYEKNANMELAFAHVDVSTNYIFMVLSQTFHIFYHKRFYILE